MYGNNAVWQLKLTTQTSLLKVGQSRFPGKPIIVSVKDFDVTEALMGAVSVAT